MVQGRLEGYLNAQGRTADPDALAGQGEIYLRDGQVQRYSLLVALGQILQIEELAQLKFDEAHIKYRIEPGVVLVDELLFRSPNIRLSAQGTVNFRGKMRLEAQLAVSDQVGGTLFGALRRNFVPTAEPGFRRGRFQCARHRGQAADKPGRQGGGARPEGFRRHHQQFPWAR